MPAALGGDPSGQSNWVVAAVVRIAGRGVLHPQVPPADAGAAQHEQRPLQIRQRERRLRRGIGEWPVRDGHADAEAARAPPEQRRQQGEPGEIFEGGTFIHGSPPGTH